MTDSLRDVVIAETVTIPISPGDFGWDEYGLRVHIPHGMSPSSAITEHISVAALVGGKFVFPAKTKLVSAVYAVKVSKQLVKSIKLEMQHCVNLTRKEDLKHLKFFVAPHTSPYKFQLVEGGMFNEGSWYGSIYRKEFSLFCILIVEDDDGSSDEDDDEGAQPGPSETQGDSESDSGSSNVSSSIYISVQSLLIYLY